MFIFIIYLLSEKRILTYILYQLILPNRKFKIYYSILLIIYFYNIYYLVFYYHNLRLIIYHDLRLIIIYFLKFMPRIIKFNLKIIIIDLINILFHHFS